MRQVYNNLRNFISMDFDRHMVNIYNHSHKEELSRRNKVPMSISARHVHLTKEHLEILFGEGYELTKFKYLSQPGQYAANEKVTLVTEKATREGVRILGPVRTVSQVEISMADARRFGLDVPVRASGNIEGSASIKLIGPKGTVELTEGCILAERHIHMSEEDAKLYKVVNGQRVRIRVNSARGGILDNVIIRVNKNYNLDMHIDTDDANAFLIKSGDLGDIIIE